MAGSVNSCQIQHKPAQSDFSKFPSPQSESFTVFQCEACGEILGDSSAFTSHSEHLRVIGVKEVHSGSLQTGMLYEKCDAPELIDSDSVFRKVSCTRCSQQVGMIFSNLPKHLSHFNNQISLLVDKIRTSHNIPLRSCKDDQCLMHTIKKMQEEISKIQFVVLNMNERLQTLEECLSTDGESKEG